MQEGLNYETHKAVQGVHRRRIVKKQLADVSRARFLVSESEKSYAFLLEIVRNYDITSQNASTIIKLAYDIIMEMIRACMLKEGYNASGQGAHAAEVSYLREVGFRENDIQFSDQMRSFRNGIMYYGRQADEEYAKSILEFTKKLYPILKNKVE